MCLWSVFLCVNANIFKCLRQPVNFILTGVSRPYLLMRSLFLSLCLSLSLSLCLSVREAQHRAVSPELFLCVFVSVYVRESVCVCVCVCVCEGGCVCVWIAGLWQGEPPAESCECFLGNF